MLKVLTTIQDFKKWRSHTKGSSIGLVPTMGNLHCGHLSLIEHSLNDNELTIISIFVNPKQFGKNEDLEHYPKTLTQDLLKIEEISLRSPSKELVIFAPKSESDVYGEDNQTSIITKSFTGILCDHFRPGHFDGVTTVVHRLFALTRPTIAYFGQKDYQQFKIIEKMTFDLLLPVEIKMLAIIRDKNGLALSSRNQYLNPSQIEKALILPRTLEIIANDLARNSLDRVRSQIEQYIANDSSWQYLDLRDAKTLDLPHLESTQLLLAGAYFVGQTRLIDNKLVDLP